MELRATNLEYRSSDCLAASVRLFLSPSMIRLHDAGNRLKDVLDAPQGQAGRSGAVRTLPFVFSRRGPRPGASAPRTS